MYLIMACNGFDCLRYELEFDEAFGMARTLRRIGWTVDVFKEERYV